MNQLGMAWYGSGPAAKFTIKLDLVSVASVISQAV